MTLPIPKAPSANPRGRTPSTPDYQYLNRLHVQAIRSAFAASESAVPTNMRIVQGKLLAEANRLSCTYLQSAPSSPLVRQLVLRVAASAGNFKYRTKLVALAPSTHGLSEKAWLVLVLALSHLYPACTHLGMAAERAKAALDGGMLK